MSWTWLGLAVLVLLAFSMVDGYQKGFVKEVVSAFLVLISVVMVWLINPYVNQFIRENTAVYEKIQTSSESFVSSLVDGRGIMDEEGQNELISSMNLPELLQELLRIIQHLYISSWRQIHLRNIYPVIWRMWQ